MERIEIGEINKILHENHLIDLMKPKLNRFNRAKIIKEYMSKNILSLNDMCKKFGFKKDTLSGWLKWDMLMLKKYNSLKKSGFGESEITRMLKRGDTSATQEFLYLMSKLSNFMDKAGNKLLRDKKDEEAIRTFKNKLTYILYKNGKN